MSKTSPRDEHELPVVVPVFGETDNGEKLQASPTSYVTGPRLGIVCMSFLLAASLMALDQTIIATALPSIASEFNAVSRLSWIAGGYFLPQAGLMLLMGQILSVGHSKWIFLLSIAVFELGSLLCAVSTSVDFLIISRVIAGVGAAGIWISVLSIVAEITKLEDRPLLLGSFGAVFAIASIVGPLLGGVFAEKLTWRWCFWINLPLGGLSMAMASIVLPKPRLKLSKETLRHYQHIDWLGSALSTSAVVLFLLPLQWGGNEKPWNDAAVISTFCLSGVFLVLFLLWEWHCGENAILPFGMLRRRTQIGACVESFFLYICFVLGTYYLPFFYQAQGDSATRSGIDILAYMLSGVLSAAGAGAIVNFSHRYWPFTFFPPLLAAVGAGLLFTITVNTSGARLIGYQIIYGVGVGAALQNTVLAVQADYADDPKRVSQATSMCSFSQLLGLSVGIAAGGAMFANKLKEELSQDAASLPAEIIDAVQRDVRAIFRLPLETQVIAIAAYTSALRWVFVIAIPSAALAACFALLIKNKVLATTHH